jgi:hypothetical protein
MPPDYIVDPLVPLKTKRCKIRVASSMICGDFIQSKPARTPRRLNYGDLFGNFNNFR